MATTLKGHTHTRWNLDWIHHLWVLVSVYECMCVYVLLSFSVRVFFLKSLIQLFCCTRDGWLVGCLKFGLVCWSLQDLATYLTWPENNSVEISCIQVWQIVNVIPAAVGLPENNNNNNNESGNDF